MLEMVRERRPGSSYLPFGRSLVPFVLAYATDMNLYPVFEVGGGGGGGGGGGAAFLLADPPYVYTVSIGSMLQRTS